MARKPACQTYYVPTQLSSKCIDELSQQVFKSSLPPTWVVNEHFNDYGKDYLVEIAEDNGELTGTSFYVQLKGQRKVRLSKDKNFAKFSLKSQYSRYYANRVRDLPVFIVVADVTSKQSWWLFLQRLLKKDTRWKKSGSMMLDIPTSNKLSDTKALREAVEQSARWVRSQHPTVLPDAMEAYKENLKELDPRFDYKVTHDGGSMMIHINPDKPVEMLMELKGEPTTINKKIHDLVGKGLRVKFDPGELTIKGSKLFDDVREHGVEVQAEFCQNASLNLILYDSSKSELSKLEGIPVVLRGGQSEVRFEGRLGRSPLYVSGGPLATNEFGKLNLSFKFEQWNGYPILALPFFDQLLPFLSEMEKTKQLGFELFVEGNRIVSITSNEAALDRRHISKHCYRKRNRLSVE
ncbi:MAG: DUF4365 domain-containing protein [Pirellulaceae bacterium]|nr:DUF4365 domain-containing protein [Pirellulaceae bacterium]